MTNLVEQLKLIEKAREDIYFAKIDRQLIAALQKRLEGNSSPTEEPGQYNHESVKRRHNPDCRLCHT